MTLERTADWISLEDALEQILAASLPTSPENVALNDAFARVLAEDVRSSLDLPPWDNSAMDGFAVRSADILGSTAERPVRLQIAGSIYAGSSPPTSVGPGEAIKIMTGAPVPSGADSVIRVEHTRSDGESVLVLADTDATRNIRLRGEDIRADEIAVEQGTQLRPAEVGLLASLGRARVRVHRKPVVAILSTGDELVDVGGFEAVLAGRAIVNSNSYALAAAVRSVGAEPLVLGIARDDKESLRTHLKRGLTADVLVTSAGASVGEHDLVKDVLEELSAETSFWRVRIRPGSPFSFGQANGVSIFGLPGNPVSAVVTFEILVKPALRKMTGRRMLYTPVVCARLGETISSRPGLTQFMRVRLSDDGGTLVANLTGAQGSGILSSLARADGLMVVPEDVTELPAGTEVKVVRLLHSDETQNEQGFKTRMNT